MSHSLFSERAAELPPYLNDFAVATSKWEELPDWVLQQLIEEGEAALRRPYPHLDALTYLGYTRSGDRLGHETPYFERRRLLNAFVMAECAERRGRFTDRIVEGVWLLCEESGWQLPAHNSLVRGGARLALPDPDRPVIDLFAAETAAQLAVTANLLGAGLDRAAPGIVARIDRELQLRLFSPYIDQHFWWMGQGDEPMSNWTAWCTQNVLLAALTRPTTQDFRRAVVRKAAASLDAFAKDYGDDGACEEGVLYYRHAGLCLFNALQVLDAVAPNCFGLLRKEPKIRNIANYIVDMHVAGQCYFNFADSSAVVERCGAREFLFGRAVGSQALADFAAADWGAERRVTLTEEINLFYRVQAAFAAPELARHAGGTVTRRDAYFPSIGLMVARDARFALAVKAGDNGDSHNHNDVGSLILYKDGRPVLIDVGVETYTAKTFSARRYEIWTMQSAFHNLPSFGGIGQEAGEAFGAKGVEVQLSDGAAAIEMDIAAAYPADAGVRSYRRLVELAKGKGVVVSDSYDGDRRAVVSLMFAQEPQATGNRIVLLGLANFTLSGAGEVTVETIPIADSRLRKAWPDRLYRALVPIEGGTLRIEIE